MQLVEAVSRKVVKVQEPTGKGPFASVALFAAVPFEDAAGEL